MSTLAPPRPAVDPRLRARRLAVAREAGRRRLHRLVALGSALGLLLVVAGVTRSPLLAVHSVDIAGAQHTSDNAISAAIGEIHGKPIYSVDTGAIARRLDALPWIASASVSRGWPQTIKVHIIERTALAAVVGTDGTYRLVDAQGRILEALSVLPPDMVEVVGPQPAGTPGTTMNAAAAGALAVAAALPPSLAGKVTQVEWTADGQVRLGLSPQGRVLFGPPTAIAEKLLALDTMVRAVSAQEVGEIDVRAPDAPVLHEADPSAVTAPTSVPPGAGP